MLDLTCYFEIMQIDMLLTKIRKNSCTMNEIVKSK